MAIQLNTERTRLRWEQMIRWIDITIGLVVFGSGWSALLATPESVLHQVYFDWLIWIWGGLLVLGGLLAAVGRFLRIWVIELPGLVAGMFGVAIFVVVLISLAFGSTNALVAVGLAVVAFAVQLRRYVELQLFTLNPRERHLPYRLRLREAMKRKTPNYLPRQDF